MRFLSLKNIWLATLVLLITTTCCAGTSPKTLQLASTTSINDSGLLAYLLPKFEEKTHITTKILTDQPIRTAQACKIDALLVDDPKAELTFMDKGYGDSRQEIMESDFILVGPKNNPAEIDAKNDISDAMKKIVATKSNFVSRSDNSETNKAELRLWQAADILTRPLTKAWYHATGTDMKTVLTLAVTDNAYTLTDRASWLNLNNRGNLVVVYEGGPSLSNKYSVITVSTTKCPTVNHAAATTFSNWLSSSEGQQIVGDFKINNEVAFKPIGSEQTK